MIPKIIHYCWFGGNPLPESAHKCIDSWRRFFPDHEIKEWNETNFPMDFNAYAKQAYDCKKYAFFTDVARLYLVYTYGGIYFDVDVEVIKPFGDILNHNAFFGLECTGKVNTGLGFGAEANNAAVKAIFDSYAGRTFLDGRGHMDLTPCPDSNSIIIKKMGFALDNTTENVEGNVVYPMDVFNPQGGYAMPIRVTENTVSIHHFDGTWLPSEEKARAEKLKWLKEKYGEKTASVLWNTFYLPYRFISHLKERKVFPRK